MQQERSMGTLHLRQKERHIHWQSQQVIASANIVVAMRLYTHFPVEFFVLYTHFPPDFWRKHTHFP